MYNRIKNNKLEELIKININTDTHLIRKFNLFKLPKIKNEQGRNTFEYFGMELWNQTPREIREINNTNLFKKHLKKWLLINNKI